MAKKLNFNNEMKKAIIKLGSEIMIPVAILIDVKYQKITMKINWKKISDRSIVPMMVLLVSLFVFHDFFLNHIWLRNLLLSIIILLFLGGIIIDFIKKR